MRKQVDARGAALRRQRYQLGNRFVIGQAKALIRSQRNGVVLAHSIDVLLRHTGGQQILHQLHHRSVDSILAAVAIQQLVPRRQAHQPQAVAARLAHRLYFDMLLVFHCRGDLHLVEVQILVEAHRVLAVLLRHALLRQNLQVLLDLAADGVAESADAGQRSHIVLKALRHSYGIVEFQRLGIIHLFAVDHHTTVLDFERFAGQTDAALDEILALVDRTHDDIAENALVGENSLTAVFAHQLVVRAVALERRADRVAVGIVEHRGIQTPDAAQAGIAVIGQLDPFQVRLLLAVGERQHIVHQRERQRRHRRTRAIRGLADHQVVANHQRLLHRRRRYLIKFQAVAPDDDSGDKGKHHSVGPFARVGILLFLVRLGVHIFQFAKAQIRHIGKREQHRQRMLPETVAAENLGRLDHQHQEREEIDGRDKEIDVPLPPLAAQLDPQDDVPQRHKGLPRRDAHFLENEPQPYEGTKNIDQCKDVV